MLNIKHLLIIPLLILLLKGQAQTIVSYKILKDSTYLYQPEDLINISSEKLKPLYGTNLNIGLTDAQYWIMIEINHTEKNMYLGKLVIDYPLLNEISFYKINNGDVIKKEPPLNSHTYVFDVKTEPNSKSAYLLRIHGNSTPKILPIYLDTSTNVMSNELLNTFIDGTFYGILFLLFILFLTVNFLIKRRVFKILLLYIGVSIFYFIISDGYLIQFHFTNNIDLQFQLLLLIIPCLIFVYERFQQMYFINLKIHTSKKTTFRIFYLVSAIMLIVIASNLLPYNFNFIITYLYAIIAIPIISVHMNKKRSTYKTAVLTVAISAIVLDLGFVIDLLHKTGLLENNFITINVFKIAFISHISILLLGATYRFQEIKKKLSNHSLQLCELVKEKTTEINQQNNELKIQTEQLQLQKEELQTQKETLLEQNIILEKLNLAVSNTENVIYIFDPQGKLLWFNNSFSSRLGVSYDNKQNKDKINICEISSYEKISDAVKHAITARETIRYEAEIKHSGSPKWYQTTLTPVLENKSIKYIVAIDSDITRLKNYEKEIVAQRHDFEMQKNLAIKQHKEVKLQQMEITDSLNYAKRIQSAILPSSHNIAKFFSESFVLFKPRDIVSGDFYWFHRIENKNICVVVDCTGHGVPGAFMSIIGTYLLNNIIIQNNETRPSEILKQLNRKLKISLKNNSFDSKTNDGMDVALVVVDETEKTLTFSGALRPLFLFQNGIFIEQKGDKNPITSAISGNTSTIFNEYTYNVNKDDVFYIFTDGIVDQFGGENDKKFLTKRLKQIILDSQIYPLDEQKRIIQKSINNWKGKSPQIDDILILGVKI